MLKVGDPIPDATLMTMTADGPKPVKTGDFFKGKTVALFALPGAFTPTCSAKHLPGFIDNETQLRAKGVDVIACLSVNDAFVMGAWGKHQKADDKVVMLADGSAEFTKKAGLQFDLTERGMGVRSQRYSMVVKDGKVAAINVEKPGDFSVSSAEALLKQL